jgi:hypothetical protein
MGVSKFSEKKKKTKDDKELSFWDKLLKSVGLGESDSKEKEKKKKDRKVTDMLFKGLKGLFTGITSIAKSLIGNAAGILGFLFALFVILKLGMLQTLLPVLLNLLKTLVTGIISVLPSILKFMFNLVVEWVPKLIMDISNAISDALGLNKDSTFRKIMPVLVAFASGLFALSKIFSLLGMKTIPSLITGLKYLFMGIRTLMTGAIMPLVTFLVSNPIGWIILAIAAVVAGLILLWKYAEPVSDFFDDLWGSFKQLNIVGKTLIGVLSLIMFPITYMIGEVVALAKLFKSIKQIGFAKTMKSVWKSLTDPFVRLGAFISSIWDDVINKIKSFLEPIFKTIEIIKKGKDLLGDFFTPIFAKIKKIFMSIGDAVGSMFDAIVYGIASLWPKAAEWMGISLHGAKTASQFHIMKKAESFAEDPSSERASKIKEYAKASVEERKALKTGMTDEDIAFAEGAKNLLKAGTTFKQISEKINNEPAANTKAFGLNANSTAIM